MIKQWVPETSPCGSEIKVRGGALCDGQIGYMLVMDRKRKYSGKVFIKKGIDKWTFSKFGSG